MKSVHMDPTGYDDLKREVEILSSINHKNVIQCYDFFEDKTNSTYWMLLEIVEGGELFDRIQAKTTYNEREARSTINLLLHALAHIHDHKIAHRDLKPENLLLKSKHNDTELKIADFGFAVKTDGDNLNQMCGTPGYVAPEILLGKNYGMAVDIWAAGVILYILLGGYPPFYADTDEQMYKDIIKGKFKFDVSLNFQPSF